MGAAPPVELTIRAGQPEDVDSILELVRLSMGTGDIPRERAYWEWKHVRNPFGASPVLLAEAEGKLVGLRVFMRWEWLREGRRLRAVRAVDTATHPEWQGRGIFSRLTRELVARVGEEGVDFIFNTPNAKSRPGYLKMGWQSVGRVDLLIKPLRPLKIARSLAAREASAEPTRRAPMEPDGAPPQADMSVAEFLALPGRAELLAGQEQASPRGRLATPRTVDYLRWRYAEIPGFQYHASRESDGAYEFAVIWRSRRRGPLTELRLSEVFAPPNGAVAARLARRLIRRLTALGDADYVSAMAPTRSPAWFALVGAGFLPTPRLGPILTVRHLERSRLDFDPARRSAWSLAIGDLEIF